jgi:hypothetical protein
MKNPIISVRVAATRNQVMPCHCDVGSLFVRLELSMYLRRQFSIG